MRNVGTGTGRVLESVILPALTYGGYEFNTQVTIGIRPGGKRHRVDVLAENSKQQKFLISLKWQQSQGSAEEKVPYEILCLADAVYNSDGVYTCAYLIVAGEGWAPSLREFYLRGGLRDYMNYKNMDYSKFVTVLNLESFIARANRGSL